MGMRASLVPLRFPYPVCRPSLLASAAFLARARECLTFVLRMISWSFASFRMACPAHK